jgi:hypothetical protein
VDLLERHHRGGLRFEPDESVERGPRVAVSVHGGAWKVFTFSGDEAVLLQDCVDREDALAQLAAD